MLANPAPPRSPMSPGMSPGAASASSPQKKSQHRRVPSSSTGALPIASMMAKDSNSKQNNHKRGPSIDTSKANDGCGLGKENSPYPASPVTERFVFPTSGSNASFRDASALKISQNAPQATVEPSGGTDDDQHGNSRATVTRGRAIRRREPLKTVDGPGSSPRKNGEMRERKSKSRQRTLSTGETADSEVTGQLPRSRTASSFQTLSSKEEIDADFINLLSQMEVSHTLRSKLVNLDSSVKLSMLKGKETLTLASLGFGPAPRTASPSKMSRTDIPKSRSSGGLSPGLQDNSSDSLGDKTSRKPSPGSSNTNRLSKISMRSRANSITSIVTVGMGGGKDGMSASRETPAYFATLLKANGARLLDVAKVKRMRAVLATETPSWITEFAYEHDGYKAMLTRLEELLDMEWREEQHDDLLLHELLRCFVALSTTDRGRSILQSQAPTPFAELVDMLFSEKRPGDLPTRKLIPDLILILLELDLSASTGDLQAISSTRQIYSRLSQAALPQQNASNEAGGAHLRLTLAERLVLTLLHNPRDPSKEAIVDFISASHTPRPFKTYLNEVCSVARDYFWIFCHGQNRYWRLEDVDVAAVEGPQVPGGMTGGVEFEAMGYLTSHMRLINSISRMLLRPQQYGESTQAAQAFHEALFLSGIDRLLGVLRRASQTYYQPMHLELSRFFEYCEQSGYVVPAGLAVWHAPSQNAGYLSTPSSPRKNGVKANRDRPVPAPPTTAGKASGSPGKSSAVAAKSSTTSPALMGDTLMVSSPRSFLPTPSLDDGLTLSALADQILSGSREEKDTNSAKTTASVPASDKPNKPTRSASDDAQVTGAKKSTDPSKRVQGSNSTAPAARDSPVLVPSGAPLPTRTPPSAASAPRFPNPYDSEPVETSAGNSKTSAPCANEGSKTNSGSSHSATSLLKSPEASSNGLAVPTKTGSSSSATTAQARPTTSSYAQNSVVGSAIRKWEERASSSSGSSSSGGSANASPMMTSLSPPLNSSSSLRPASLLALSGGAAVGGTGAGGAGAGGRLSPRPGSALGSAHPAMSWYGGDSVRKS